MFARALLGLAPLALASPSFAQCGEWDTGFRLPGITGVVHALAAFDDGSGPALYAGGDFAFAGDLPARNIARWDGAAWSSVGGDFDARVLELAVLDLGSGPALYAGGAFTNAAGVPASRVARWDGTTWSALGAGTDGWVTSLTTFDDGSGTALFAAGGFATAGSVAASRIAKWDGANWSALGMGISGPVTDLAVYDHGAGPALYALGAFSYAGGVEARRIASWDGASWSPLPIPMHSYGNALGVFDDGAGPVLYITGSAWIPGGLVASGIVRWDGTSWGPVGGGVNSTVSAFQVFDDGTGPALYVAGGFPTVFDLGNVPVGHIARWDGSAWSTLENGTDESVLALAVFDDGSGPALYLGGVFESATGVPAKGIVRWNAPGWSALDPGSGLQGLDEGVSALLAFDDGSGPALYAGGTFRLAGDAHANRVAKWDGSAWSRLGSGISGEVRALAAFDDGSGPALYAGGSFLSAGGVEVHGIARWNGTGWTGLAGGTGGSSVGALAVYDDGSGPALYAGGNFSMMGGVAASGIAKWDGVSWSALGGGATTGWVRVLAVCDVGSGPALYAGGEFTSISGVPAKHVARWDGTSWSALGPATDGTNGPVYALAASDDGAGGEALYVGGTFTQVGGFPARYLARWNGTSWSPMPADPDQFVVALAAGWTSTGETLAVGGGFRHVGDIAANRVAMYSNGVWRALDSGLAPMPGTGSGGFALAFLDDDLDGDLDLFAGSSLQLAGGVPSASIARWIGCGPEPSAYCFGDGTLPTACPCENPGLGERGCDNSFATGGARLEVSGTISPDTIVLTSSGELPSAPSILLQGDASSFTGLPFGDGLRCVGGNLLRLYTGSAVAGVFSVPQLGDPSISTRSAALGAPIAPGSVRHYQAYYRDPDPSFCPAPFGGTWNTSGAIRIPW